MLQNHRDQNHSYPLQTRAWVIRCSSLLIFLILCRPSVDYDNNENGIARNDQLAAPTQTTTAASSAWPVPPNLIRSHERVTQLTMQDFEDLALYRDLSSTSESLVEAVAKRQPIVDLLQRAGLQVDLEVLTQLMPTEQHVTDLYGSKPVILGKNTCRAFRNAVPADRRFVGVAGQMNVGTNALALYLRDNLVLPQNPVHNGMLWTVPWSKHSWAALRNKLFYRVPDNHATCLPVIVVRDPYFWMKSMCESPYTMEWNRTAQHCPNLIEETTVLQLHDDSVSGDLPAELGVPVHVQWGRFKRKWHSLAHVWSEWYQEYVDADYPRLIIRFEDLLFRTETVLDEIRECVGASWKQDQFLFRTTPAKQHPYFDQFKKQNGLVAAFVKYGRDHGERTGNMTQDDLDYAERFVSPDLMRLFNYGTPDAVS
jgi:hypothetical protein